MCNSNKDRVQFDTYYTNAQEMRRLTCKAYLIASRRRYHHQRQRLQARRSILPQNIQVADVDFHSPYILLY